MSETKKDYEKIEELYELYEQKIYYVAFTILNNIQQAEDAVQETFIALYENLETLHGFDTEQLNRYILRIAKNKAIDSYRKNKRHVTFLEDYRKEAQELSDENIEKWEQRQISEIQIDSLLIVLNDSYRQVFKYKIFYNLSYLEISKRLGITEATVRKQFERARKRVQTVLGGRQNDESKRLQKHV
ncbi:RNA polymerase sigma factor [Neobacillus notoginsengisoli]|uniref:RNA polymerase sigma factor n=1 Tax=Neobacillus notoginsengisoli TaxID=1578198 RepID=A0A417Z050_9BACI|nr:RNA polymerase sigma factor [Neobacillus notoginsengisoli]RHW43301.1 RNA polymerase sigma factor [Neobacillus notoginsengisoli]